MYEKFGQFVDHKCQELLGKKTYEVLNPANEEFIGKTSKANGVDVQKAIKSAKSGFEIRKDTSPWREKNKILLPQLRIT